MTIGRCDIPACGEASGKHGDIYVLDSGREFCPCEDHHPGGRFIGSQPTVVASAPKTGCRKCGGELPPRKPGPGRPRVYCGSC